MFTKFENIKIVGNIINYNYINTGQRKRSYIFKKQVSDMITISGYFDEKHYLAVGCK